MKLKTAVVSLFLSVATSAQFDPCSVDLWDDVEFEEALDIIQMQEALRLESIQFDGVGDDWNPWREWSASQWLLGVGSMSHGAVYADQPFGGWLGAVDWVQMSVARWNATHDDLLPYQVALMRVEAASSADYLFNVVLQGQVAHMEFLWDQKHAYTLYGFEIAKINAYSHREAGNSCGVIFDFYRDTIDAHLESWDWYTRKLGWFNELLNCRFRVVDTLGNPDETIWGFWVREVGESWMWQLFNYWPGWSASQ